MMLNLLSCCMPACMLLNMLSTLAALSCIYAIADGVVAGEMLWMPFGIPASHEENQQPAVVRTDSTEYDVRIGYYDSVGGEPPTVPASYGCMEGRWWGSSASH